MDECDCWGAGVLLFLEQAFTNISGGTGDSSALLRTNSMAIDLVAEVPWSVCLSY